MMLRLLVLLLSVSFCLKAEEKGEKKLTDQEVDIQKISEAFGHLIGKNLDTLGVKFDLKAVVQGLQDSCNGKQSPLSEVECIQAISAAQEAAFRDQSKQNLARAEQFLKSNAGKENVVALENGKLQYVIEKEGNGKKVEPEHTPLIKYVGKYLDGSIFGASKEDEVISLDEIITGFSKGLIGMKEGEKRILYIHPDFGYGTSGYLPPNSLLTFEVELIQANVPNKEETSSVSVKSQEKANSLEKGSPSAEKTLR